MPDIEAKTVHKNPRPGGQRLFLPKPSDYEKRQKIDWPLPVGPTHKPPPNKVHHKMKAPKPTRKKQPAKT